jgi:GxxExxY protein
MTENVLAKEAVDIAFKIHTAIGPGLLETVYQAAFILELEERNIPYKQQKPILAVYRGQDLGIGFRADIILEDKLIIELKSVEHLEKVHHKILLTYLKLSGLKLGLLINFNVDLIKDGIHRKIVGKVC